MHVRGACVACVACVCCVYCCILWKLTPPLPPPLRQKASELVLALASLLCPLGYNGDCRPFMQPKDGDVRLLRDMSRTKQQERREQEAKALLGQGFSTSTAM